MRVCPAQGGDKFAQFNGNGAVFTDDQESFSTVEPATDLTAASFLMFAWRTAGSPAVLLPGGDVSTAQAQATAQATMLMKPNPQWPPRRGARHRSRATLIPAKP